MPKILILLALPAAAAAVVAWQALQAPALPVAPCLPSAEAARAAATADNPALEALNQRIAHFEQQLAAQPGAHILADQLIAGLSTRFRASGQLADWQRAHELSTQALAARPQHPRVQARHANLLNMVHRFDEALPLAQEAAQRQPNDQTLGTWFDSLLELGRQAEAETVLARIGDASIPGALRHARWADLKGDSARTIDRTRHALNQARKQSMNPLAQAGLQANLGVFLLYDSADPRDGLTQLCEALEQHPTQVAALQALAGYAWHRGQLELAYALAQAATASPVHVESRLLAAELALARGDTASAARHRAAFEAVAGSDGPLFELVLAEHLASHAATRDDAVRIARQAHARRPAREVADTLAWVLMQAGQAEQALAYSDQVASSGAMHAPLAYRRGVILAANGQQRAAADSLRAALDGQLELHPPEVRDARQLLERLSAPN